MRRQASSIVFILIKTLFVVFNKVNAKSGGGHYSSQRSLGAGPSGGHGVSMGSQHWSNSFFPQDMNSWYEYGKYL
jgi:hypothetical protein